MSKLIRFAAKLSNFLLWLGIGLCVFWSALALWFDSSAPKIWVSSLLLLLTATFFVFRKRKLRMAVSLALFATVLAWWLSIAPRNDRDWIPDVAQLPFAEINGDEITIHNVRNFEYRSETDFTPIWETRKYDLAKLRGVDLFLSDWGATGIVHTIASWDFEDGEDLAISIETRKEVGEDYSAVRGFFRQYELYYVIADERDVIGVRSRFRGERMRLYRLRSAPGTARAMLLSYLETINKLKEKPAWYNALSANCTTTIRVHAQQIGIHNAWNWRLLANKNVDELLYMRRELNTSMSLEKLRQESEVTDKIISAATSPEFSTVIRESLPPRPVE